MTKLYGSGATRVALFTLTGLVLSFAGCSNPTPMAPEPSGRLAPTEPSILNDFRELGLDLPEEGLIGEYLEYAKRTLHYQVNRGVYNGGNVNVPGGSTFHLKEGALSAPPGTPFGADVTITMLVARVKSQDAVLFSFGPSGCRFDPPAEVWFDWSDFGWTDAKLYYIAPDGSYVEQPPDDVDYQGKRVKLYIDHFSRYALARSG